MALGLLDAWFAQLALTHHCFGVNYYLSHTDSALGRVALADTYVNAWVVSFGCVFCYPRPRFGPVAATPSTAWAVIRIRESESVELGEFATVSGVLQPGRVALGVSWGGAVSRASDRRRWGPTASPVRRSSRVPPASARTARVSAYRPRERVAPA